MTKKLNIPDEVQGTFKRLMNSVPHELRNDIDTQRIILVYLKIGGAKLARQGVEVIKMLFQEKALENKLGTQISRESYPAGTHIFEPPNLEHNGLEFPTE